MHLFTTDSVVINKFTIDYDYDKCKIRIVNRWMNAKLIHNRNSLINDNAIIKERLSIVRWQLDLAEVWILI